ncbi:putative transporter [Ceratocystis lukuohia]|uniref:Transporter n=1 Tax=Ceratocystis lukuohia TaxID=2019550 RepID=A0ABR4MJM9_9PEZI
MEKFHDPEKRADANDDPTLKPESPEDFGFSPEKQRRIIRTIDRRLVVIVGVMYCISLMDRTNMSAAAIAGMRTEIGLLDNKYQVANLVFFITYTLFQPPSTILIRKIGPRIHLSLITLLWGGVLIGMGFVDNFGQLAVCRVMLGLLEAGFFPSCVYLLSTWYTRFEVGKRYSVFYLLGSFASGCSGILAYGLMQMDGLGDLTGWRWIFIMEGIMTCVIACIGYWLLVDFPDSNRESWNFLGPRERAWVVSRVEKDRGDSVISKFNLAVFLRSGKDWKIWLYALAFFSNTTQSYAMAYTLPIILISSLKFSVAEAQCLVAPPYALAGILMYVAGYIGDRYHIRGPIVALNSVVSLVGLSIMGFASDPWFRYFGVFLTTAGSNGNIPGIMAYQANNIRGQWKRAFCSATMVGFGGIGGIAGSLVFRDQDAPGYKPGYYACMTCSVLTILVVVVLSVEFRRQNGKAARGEKVLEASEMETDDGFRYTY